MQPRANISLPQPQATKARNTIFMRIFASFTSQQALCGFNGYISSNECDMRTTDPVY